MEKGESFVVSGKDADAISKMVEKISEEVSLNALGYIVKYFEKKEQEKEEEKKHRYDRVLHNTELLMNNYRNFKQHITGLPISMVSRRALPIKCCARRISF